MFELVICIHDETDQQQQDDGKRVCREKKNKNIYKFKNIIRAKK